MNNLTFEEGLIRAHRIEPLEGHTVVVLERVGDAGERFHSLLEPGTAPPRNGLRRSFGTPARYFAFAVDASKARLLDFTEQVEMAEGAQAFEVHFSLFYRVSDPKLLVTVRNSDPLQRVRRQVADVVIGEVA